MIQRSSTALPRSRHESGVVPPQSSSSRPILFTKSKREPFALRNICVSSRDSATCVVRRTWHFREISKAAENNWADAVKNHAGPWVPNTVIGGNANGTNGASTLIDLLTAKTAQDLGLEMTPGKK